MCVCCSDPALITDITYNNPSDPKNFPLPASCVQFITSVGFIIDGHMTFTERISTRSKIHIHIFMVGKFAAFVLILLERQPVSVISKLDYRNSL